ncbi:major tail protein [Halobacillus litoralis]|uniref:major tail protein n=1 Tax=Halobacillus litoralis TaxID=45668 RepID=UPI001CD759BA|nr:major tail protein [Halobacillus litoralis]MCA1021794.1 phage tail protein [Halobacillus litoralis]
MPEEKNYRKDTGVDEFYYGLLSETGTELITGDPERVKFLQNITVEMPQEPVRAYGDNTTAEIAVSDGPITVNGAFHKIPSEDKEKLLGLEKTTSGLLSYGSGDNPPYVACIFAKTYEDGSKEWVGLLKGMFMRPNVNAQTKGESTEFSAEEITASFMDREVSEFPEGKSVLMGKDPKGDVTMRDALFQEVFGKPHPGAAPEGV